eukprot:Blabericola_migrator_1__8430@NODE_4396_length_1182_cov_67_564126_g2721_i0_p1_GENE_NODE_4396_length_1182_cov_67_564126_g2721_i0NODE_4396_length_1182_cov_67_564126_g2721_i0_p1_ORF_typecomplete_len154_score26_19_NODE_4396_length_1182_cov_67_564126_g2721_i095556
MNKLTASPSPVEAASHLATFGASSLPSVGDLGSAPGSPASLQSPDHLITGPLFDKGVLRIIEEAAVVANMTPLEERTLLYHCWKRYLRSTSVLQHVIQRKIIGDIMLPHEAAALTIAAKRLQPLVFGEIEGPHVSQTTNAHGDSNAYLLYSVK